VKGKKECKKEKERETKLGRGKIAKITRYFQGYKRVSRNLSQHQGKWYASVKNE